MRRRVTSACFSAIDQSETIPFELQGWVHPNEGMHTVGDKDLAMEPFTGELDHLKQMDLFKKEEQTQS